MDMNPIDMDGEYTYYACPNLTEDSTFRQPDCLLVINRSWEKCPSILDRCAPPSLSDVRKLRGSLLIVLFVLVLVANLFALRSIRRHMRRKRNHMYYVLMQYLTIVDILVSCFGWLMEGLWTLTVSWYAGNNACKLFKFLQLSIIQASGYTVVCIGWDRYKAVMHPIKSATSGESKCLINQQMIFVVATSMVLSAPQVFIFSVVKGPFYPEFKQCHSETTPLTRAYSYIMAMCTFVLPVIILSYVYAAIIYGIQRSRNSILSDSDENALRRLPKHSVEKLPSEKREKRLIKRVLPNCLLHEKAANSRLISPRGTPSDNNASNRKKKFKRAYKRSTAMSLCIVLAYILSWVPCHYRMFSTMMSGAKPGEKEDERVRDNSWTQWVFFFGMLNALLNPIIYFGFHVFGRSSEKRKNRALRRRRGVVKRSRRPRALLL